MYRPEIKRKRSGAPVLSRKEIDVIGQNIVGDFMPEALKSPQEIDIDLLAQDYLGMDQDFQYLSHCGVYLGMTVFNDTDKVPVYDPQNNCADYISAKAHTVIIDKMLLEENQEHRYRFTMGHEAGHEFLHKEYFAYDPDQMTLFDLMGDDFVQSNLVPYPDVEEYSDQEKLALEKSVLGVYISGHPLGKYIELMQRTCTAQATDFVVDTEDDDEMSRDQGDGDGQKLQDNAMYVIGGLISRVTVKLTKNNQNMAYVTIEDLVLSLIHI